MRDRPAKCQDLPGFGRMGPVSRFLRRWHVHDLLESHLSLRFFYFFHAMLFCFLCFPDLHMRWGKLLWNLYAPLERAWEERVNVCRLRYGNDILITLLLSFLLMLSLSYSHPLNQSLLVHSLSCRSHVETVLIGKKQIHCDDTAGRTRCYKANGL